MATVIRNGLIVTMNARRDVFRGDIRIEGNRITGLGELSVQAGDQLIDARDRIIAPGLIQSHTHLCQTLFRGMADDLELMDWLRRRIWPLEAAHDPDSLYMSALLGCGELLRGGTTSIIDMATVKHTESVFEAVSLSGIRYLGGKCLMDVCDQLGLRENGQQAIQESLDLMNKWHGCHEDRIRYALCPRFAVSCSDKLLSQVAQISQQYGIVVHTHASESLGEIDIIRKERGIENVEYLDGMGLCNSRLVLAHCIHLNEKEMDILFRQEVNVAHCPSSNLKLASGIARIPAMLSRGINVGLGADGAPCNNRLCAFTEMRQAALIHKPYAGPTAMNAQLVFEMATLNGAKAMGRQAELGSLEIGKIADLIMVNGDTYHNLPDNWSSVYSQLVYQLNGQDVDMTMVDGKVLYDQGRLCNLDSEMISRECRTAVDRIARRAGL